MFLKNIVVTTSRSRATKSRRQCQLDVEIAGNRELVLELKAARAQADVDMISRQQELEDMRKQNTMYTKAQIHYNALSQ